jgi:hypothetical protein
MRGLEANRVVVFRRAMDRWRQYSQESRQHRDLTHSLQALAMLRAVQEWRYHLKASAPNTSSPSSKWKQPVLTAQYCSLSCEVNPTDVLQCTVVTLTLAAHPAYP